MGAALASITPHCCGTSCKGSPNQCYTSSDVSVIQPLCVENPFLLVLSDILICWGTDLCFFIYKSVFWSIYIWRCVSLFKLNYWKKNLLYDDIPTDGDAPVHASHMTARHWTCAATTLSHSLTRCVHHCCIVCSCRSYQVKSNFIYGAPNHDRSSLYRFSI